jgi:hypothetical protein
MGYNATRPASTSLCSGTKASKSPTIFRTDVLAQEIEGLEAALEQFREFAADLGAKDTEP